MRLLLDTNIFLELILEQEAAEQARALLEQGGQHELFVSDYTVHSIGLLLFRRNQHEAFRAFVADLVAAAIGLLALDLADTGLTVEPARRFGLDFDDAYQYALAERYGLLVVSFDRDFDRTERGRKTPTEV